MEKELAYEYRTGQYDPHHIQQKKTQLSNKGGLWPEHK